MGLRRDHYERAFEHYLRCKGCPYVVVDEARRKAFAAVALKNFDFLVYSAAGANLLVDVKGRKFPDLSVRGRRRSGRAWENWVTGDDLDGLAQWGALFGEGFRAVLVFAYWLQGPPETSPFADIHFWQGRPYAFAAAGLEEYRRAARRRSERWGTLAVPAKQFEPMARDVGELL